MKTTNKRRLQTLLLASISILILSGTTLAGTVAASPGQDRRNSNESVQSDTDTVADAQNDEQSREETSSRVGGGQDSTEVQNKAAQARVTAKTEIEQERAARKQVKTVEKRKRVCENRKKAIDNKLAAFNQSAEKHLTKLKDIDAKLRSYQLKQAVQADGYDALVATADAKRTAAEAAVSTLKVVGSDVDCANPDTVVTLRAVKDTAIETRRALHEYRLAIKAILTALTQTREDKTTSTTTQNDPSSPNNTDATDSTSQVSAQEGAN